MKTIIKTLFILALSAKAFAQSGTMAPNYLIVPSVSTNGTCDVPSKGKTVFNSTDNKMYYCDGTVWQGLTGAAASGSVWTQTGNDISNTNTGNVGIGFATPLYKFAVNGNSFFGGSALNTGGGTYFNSGGALNSSHSVSSGAPIFSSTNYSLLMDGRNIQAQSNSLFSSGSFPSNLFLNPLGGNVGVGTTAPTERFTVRTPSANYGLIHTDGTIAMGTFMGSPQGKFGTKSNHDLGFFTNNGISQMTLTTAGKVGIGTSIPTEKFTIETPVANYGLIHTDGTVAMGTFMGDTQGKFGTKSNHDLGFFTGNGITQMVLNTAGNVGIGTNNPLTRLHIQTAGLGSEMGLLHSNGSVEMGTLTTTAGSAFLLTRTNHPLYFLTNSNGGGAAQMVLNTAGNVGIGTNAPDPLYRLSVNGAIRAKEVIVETSWADYVFEDDYKLKSIDEMEAYVKEFKHLPNIPKASEIENNGLKVGETSKAMMEKIEELALYIIQLKKEIDLIKSKN